MMRGNRCHAMLSTDSHNGRYSMENIRKNKPADGLVQVLKITEKQFGKMEFIVGTKKSEILDTDERVVII